MKPHVPPLEIDLSNDGLAEFGSETAAAAHAVRPVTSRARSTRRRAIALAAAIAAVVIGAAVAIPRWTSLAFPVGPATGSPPLQSDPPVAKVPRDAAPPAPAVAPSADARGSLQVTTEPGSGMVEVDGIVRGVSPVSLDDLAAGEHAVVVRDERGEHRRTVHVEAGTKTSLVISLAPPVASSGWLQPTAAMPLRIFEHGVLIGTTEASRTMLPVGRHELEFVADEFGFRERRVVYITAGRTTTLPIVLPRVAMSINATPWAEVFLDGTRLGETPFAGVMADLGQHELEFRHPELGRKTISLRVTLSEPVRLAIDMRVP